MKSLREYILESVQSDRITPDDITELKFYDVSNYNELIKIIDGLRREDFTRDLPIILK